MSIDVLWSDAEAGNIDAIVAPPNLAPLVPPSVMACARHRMNSMQHFPAASRL